MTETPIADQLEEDLKNAPVEDQTRFPEDDDPLSLAGEFVEEADPEDGN